MMKSKMILTFTLFHKCNSWTSIRRVAVSPNHIDDMTIAKIATGLCSPDYPSYNVRHDGYIDAYEPIEHNKKEAIS